MLMLKRNEGQRIYMTLPNGELVTIVVDEIRPGRVVLGFEAPRNVVIERDDVKQGPKPSQVNLIPNAEVD